MLKPKSGVHNPRALLYKRFTDVEKSNRSIAYSTFDGKLWIFDGEKSKKETDVLIIGDFSGGTTGWNNPTAYTQLSAQDGVCTVTVPANTLIQNNNLFVLRTDASGVRRNHKYYCRFNYNMPQDFGETASVTVAGKSNSNQPIIPDGQDQLFEMISDSDGTSRKFTFAPTSRIVGQTPTTDVSYQIWGIEIFDLTEDFGEGKEPTTVEEARAYYDGDPFIEISSDTEVTKKITVTSADVLKYGSNYYKYTGKWANTQAYELANVIGRNNIAQYQLNKYYFVGTFDYMRKGGIDSAETQPTRGLITPIDSMTIRYFNDDIALDHDDIVVIRGRLYSVESISTDYKMMPKEFKIHFANLNSIL